MAWEKDKWEFYQDKRGEYRWRRVASNGQLVGASTEGYIKRADCVKNAKRMGYEGEFIAAAKDKWEFYKDKKGEWRWRRTASNGQKVGAASEGYVRRIDMLKNAKRHGYQGD